MKILVVDDEYSALRNIKNHLEREKWHVELADSYDVAKEALLTNSFDVIVCDYHLSDDIQEKHGLELIKEIRQKKIQTPVIFLTARNLDEITPWDALDGGVDDFMKKPWRVRELTSRIKAVVRRYFASRENATNVIRQGNIALDLDLKKAYIGSKEVHLGNIIFLLLKEFFQKPDTLLTYRDLLIYIWGNTASQEAHKNTLRVHITHLKKILGAEAKHIRTLHGEGYIWESKAMKRGS